MRLYRVHAYDDEHYATLVIRAETAEQAGRVAVQFVAMMYLGHDPANHSRAFPEDNAIRADPTAIERSSDRCDTDGDDTARCPLLPAMDGA